MKSKLKVPNGWRIGALQDLVFFQRGFDITKAQQQPGEIPVISSSGTNSYHSESKVDGPGVIIGRKGTLGSVHYSPGPYWPHDTTLWSKDLNGNNPVYVYYFLKTLGLEQYDVGSSNPTLNRNHIHTIEIIIPNISLQDQIALKLSAYDDLIENNLRRIELIEQSALELYKEWFIRFKFPGHENIQIIDGLPEGWERKSFKDVCQSIGGGTPSTKISSYWDDGDVVWMTPTDLTKNNSIILLDSEKKITEEGLKKSSAKLLPPNTILMTSRASIGYFGLFDGQCSTNQGFISIIPYWDSHKYYLLFNLKNRVQEIISLATGATYKEINKTTFRNMDLIVPHDDLCITFTEYIDPIMDQLRCIKQQNQLLKQARDLLLPRLMKGDIEV